MNNAETKLINILTELKNCYKISGIKLEFEAEGTRYDEAVFLKNILDSLGLELTVKIGGCEALRDIYDASFLKAEAIVAPMIESEYSLLKFIRSLNNLSTNNSIKKYINIESILGINNFESIANSNEFEFIDGVVLGRSDLAFSLNLDKNFVDSNKILNYVCLISEKMRVKNKKFIIGGGILPQSIDFLKKIHHLNNFETRKVIFPAEILNENYPQNAILKALEFEAEWLKLKKDKFGFIYSSEQPRLENLLKIIDKNEKNKIKA